MSPEERAVLQGLLDDMHEQFIGAVAAGRRMPLDRVRSVADGRVFSGRQALELGLVDSLGGLEDAVRAASELAHLTGRPRLIRPRKSGSWWSLLDLLSTRLPLGPAGALLDAGRSWPAAPLLGAAKLPLYLMD
jgi:protease-4